MATVSIDLDALDDLISALRQAQGQIENAAGSLGSDLAYVRLSCPELGPLSYGGDVHGWFEESRRDLNRRLALARLIARSTPGLAVVSFDDRVLSTASAAEVQRRVERVLALMRAGEPGESRGVDDELLQLLNANALDPYFAQALGSQLSPDALRLYLDSVNRQRRLEISGGRDALRAFDERYDELLTRLGTTLSLASNGAGDLAVPGMTARWADYLKTSGRVRGTGAANLLSLVIERGQWSPDFLTETYHALRDAEGSSGAGQWVLGAPWQVVDPDLSLPPGGCRLADDPMYGVLSALADSPEAMARLFTGGPTTTLSVDGHDVTVNEELWAFARHRDGMGEDTTEAFLTAVAAAIGSPPVAGGVAFQPMLAADIANIGKALDAEAKKAEEEAGPWYAQLGHGLLDLAGFVPVIGEPADALNGLWYYADGDVINGSLSMGAVIPFAGWAATGGKWARDVIDAEKLAELTKLAEDGRHLQNFGKDGALLAKIDFADPAAFQAERFLSARELKIWSGPQEFMRPLIAGNRFNHLLNSRYLYSEIRLAKGAGRKGYVRLDAYTPGKAIVSRKLTQFSGITEKTARRYIDEFATKYPQGAKIADVPSTREMGIAGHELEGPMILEVPPQVGGTIDPAIVKYAEQNRVFIRDLNGHFYTKPYQGEGP